MELLSLSPKSVSKDIIIKNDTVSCLKRSHMLKEFRVSFSKIIVVLLLCLLILNTLQVGANAKTQTVTEDIVYRYLAEWEDQLVVSEIAFLDKNVLLLHLVTPSLDENDIDMESFSKAFFELMDDQELQHDRVYLDIVDETGERFQSYDLIPQNSFFSKADFTSDEETVEGEESENVAKNHVEIDEQFSLGGVDLIVGGYEFEKDSQGKPYIEIVFHFINNSGRTTSPGFDVDIKAEQEKKLTQNYFGHVVSGMNDDVEDGYILKNCRVRYFLHNSTDPITITFKEFMGDGVAYFVVDPTE